jgi:hypothetical protein
VDRSARPDDGNPARLIATMVGIVGILLLGSLAWSAVGALFAAVGTVTSGLSFERPTPASVAAFVGTPTAAPSPTTAATATPNARPRPTGTATPAPADTATPVAQAVTAAPTPPPSPTVGGTVAPTVNPTGRAPWILLPLPAPDARVPAGTLTIEARGRGEAPIVAMRLELDGAALPVTLEQRSDSIWRGSASTYVGPGAHSVRATAVDDQGRSGAYRWTFDAGR